MLQFLPFEIGLFTLCYCMLEVYFTGAHDSEIVLSLRANVELRTLNREGWGRGDKDIGIN